MLKETAGNNITLWGSLTKEGEERKHLIGLPTETDALKQNSIGVVSYEKKKIGINGP